MGCLSLYRIVHCVMRLSMRLGSSLINKLLLVFELFVLVFLGLPWEIQVHIGELIIKCI
eukprot:SAG11_NODE_1550_length_4699_cov_6.841522_1_plen_59_part_00